MSDIWSRVMILDGGMGTELTRCGAKDVLHHCLWSAIVNINEPEIVVQAHTNFIDAGADIILANSYKTNVPMLVDALGFTEDEAIEAMKKTIDLAFEATGKGGETLIAGTIGPFMGIPIVPMSVYHPNQYTSKVTVAELIEWHEPRFKLFYESQCHLLAIETIPNTKEIEALMHLLAKYPKQAYLSLACSFHQADCLNSDEPIADALEMIKRIKPPALRGIGVNCTKPQFIASFGKLAKSILPELTLIAYPNSGEEWHTASNSEWNGSDGEWVGKRRDLGDYVAEWRKIGFQWIGGCCRVTPDELHQLGPLLKKT